MAHPPALHVGMMMPPLETPVSRLDLVRYAGASGDLFYIHWDQDQTRALGYPDVLVHGWLSLAILLRAIHRWLPPESADIIGYSARYLKPTYPGILSCRGAITDVTQRDRGRAIDVDLWAEDRKGDIKTRASATVLVVDPR